MAKVIFQHDNRRSAKSKMARMGFDNYGTCGFANIHLTQNPNNDLDEMEMYKSEGIWFITLSSNYHVEETMTEMYNKNCKNWN